MDCICVKKKHKRRRDPKKQRPISPHVSPAHSQPSTLGHVSDPRLPKVNSTGLWIGAPSLYAAGPSPAYYYGRPQGSHKHRPDVPIHIPRAVSEQRIPQARHPYVSARPVYGSHNNVYFTSVSQPPRIPMSVQRVPVHGAQRIYHSQQLAPVFEVPATTNMEIYDVYQFAGGSRSKLLETKHTPYYHNSEFTTHRRPERSKSDAQESRSRRPEVRKDSSRKYRSPSNDSRQNQMRSSSRENSIRSSVMGEQRVTRTVDSPERPRLVTTVSEQDMPSVHVNRAFSPDTGEIVRGSSTRTRSSTNATDRSVTASVSSGKTSQAPLANGSPGMVSATVISGNNSSRSGGSDRGLSTSATDSMKLLAKNKTDDQKTSVPGMVSVRVEKNGPVPATSSTQENKNADPSHYINKEDVYSIPHKAKVLAEDEEDDNPIITRMKEMVIEKSRSSSNPSSPRDVPPTMSNQIATLNSSHEKEGHVIQEITTVTKVTRSEVIESVVSDDKNSSSVNNKPPNSGTNVFDGFVLPELDELEKKSSNEDGIPRRVSVKEDKPLTNTESLSVNVSRDEVKDKSPSPDVSRVKEPLSPRLSSDGEGTHEDLSKAGKRIAESAFNFLDKYLSDDDGTESHIDSPPMSPGGLRAQGVVD
ncbi:uncharacterized protein LOC101863806 [Aplysia californica]|uniref:Uncharacterized protein LOC101863806 n=1 Tax=Aplysia californica TaxID=6500 RepID=A0ABM0JKW7_APLCA|nr:uncharacterized protein LOC101863806 [Aplysia californica]